MVRGRHRASSAEIRVLSPASPYSSRKQKRTSNLIPCHQWLRNVICLRQDPPRKYRRDRSPDRSPPSPTHSAAEGEAARYRKLLYTGRAIRSPAGVITTVLRLQKKKQKKQSERTECLYVFTNLLRVSFGILVFSFSVSFFS